MVEEISIPQIDIRWATKFSTTLVEEENICEGLAMSVEIILLPIVAEVLGSLHFVTQQCVRPS